MLSIFQVSIFKLLVDFLEELEKINASLLQALLVELMINHPGDLERLQAVEEFNKAKKRPARAPKSAHPYMPCFR